MTDPIKVQVAVPSDIATKQLRLRTNAKGRVLTISSNLLEVFGFFKGDKVREEIIGDGGEGMMIVKCDPEACEGPVKQVYGRHYPRRKNNPFEAQLEVSSQRILERAFPVDTDRVHVVFEHGRVIVTPIRTVKDRALANARRANPRSVFAALTSGVDITSLQNNGYHMEAILEWRPQEKRDKGDLTETGLLAAMANSNSVAAVFNEDIYSVNLDVVAKQVLKRGIFLLHASPQCDDLSNVKGKKLKESAEEDLSTTADMIWDLVNLAERVAPPCILFENVPGFLECDAYRVAKLRLRRMGYSVHEHVGDARDYGGMTSRRRAYVFATVLDADFSFEAPQARNEESIWGIIEPYLEGCRDVSHSRSLQRGKENGRLRAIRPGSTYSRTPLKSQEHMCKDSLVVEPEDGKFLWPSQELLLRLMGIESMDLNCVSKTIASEIIGQSIDVVHHAAILAPITKHIDTWLETAGGLNRHAA